MRVRSLSQEDPLEEGMATHSSILARRISMDRGTSRATVHRIAKSRTRLKWLSMHTCRMHYLLSKYSTFCLALVNCHNFGNAGASGAMLSFCEKPQIQVFNWLTILYSFQMYNKVIQYFCTLQNDHLVKSSCRLSPYKVITILLAIFPVLYVHLWDLFITSLYLLISFTYFSHPLSAFLSGSHWFVLCESVSVLFKKKLN